VDSEAISITVTGPTGATALSGRLLDANVADQGGPDLPIEGATVTVSGISATTDANGDFTLSGIASGAQIFDIDSTTVINAPAGVTYAGFREEITLIADVTNVVDRPFFLPRIDPAGTQTIDPAITTVVNNAPLGVTLTVPPNTAKDELGNDFTGDLSISTVPPSLAPVALTLLFSATDAVGLVYLASAAALGAVFVIMAWKLKREHTVRKARHLYLFSLLYLALLFAVMLADSVYRF